jgi:hypothetical protein
VISTAFAALPIAGSVAVGPPWVMPTP